MGYKVHSSKTCLVIFAQDTETGLNVALKLMSNKNEWEREIVMRQTENGEELEACQQRQTRPQLRERQQAQSHQYSDDRADQALRELDH